VESRTPRIGRIGTFGQLVGGVVQDVNHLLHVVLTAATELSRSLPPGEQAALADSIAIAARRAQQLNRDLLEGSIPGTGPPATDVGGAVDQLAGLLRHLVPPGIVFTVTVDPDLPHARVEPFELDRIVTTLVRNSAEEVSEGCRIDVTAMPAALPPVNDLGLAGGDYVAVGVFDTGPGIAPAHLDRLFDPFFTTKPGASGLGLASVDWLVRRRGGAVRVTSRPEGGSTLFEVLLPAV
jgi:signal transduction histidine kinase